MEEKLESMDLFRKVNQSDYTDKMPTYPALTLTVHCAIKGVQLGSALGLATVPILQYLRKTSLETQFRKNMTKGPLVGMIVSLSMLGAKAVTATDFGIAGVDDRAYRIMKNKGQVEVDTYSILNGLFAGIGGAFISRGHILPCFFTGVAAGVVAYGMKSKLLKNLDD